MYKYSNEAKAARLTNPVNIKHKIQKALRLYLAGTAPANKYNIYFGAPAPFIREFISYQFETGMTWDNNGSVWHIDHILPVCIFDLTKPEDNKLCWNWINLRPLAAHYNKGRNSYTVARLILEHRWKYFSDNPAISGLIARATNFADREEGIQPDWYVFKERIKYEDNSALVRALADANRRHRHRRRRGKELPV